MAEGRKLDKDLKENLTATPHVAFATKEALIKRAVSIFLTKLSIYNIIFTNIQNWRKHYG